MDMKTVQSSGYPWADDAPQRHYADLLDQIVPEPDAKATVEWVRFAEELAEAAETSLEKEAGDLIAAFHNLKEHFPPEIVSCIYRLADTQNSALLANEFVPAAEALQNGVAVEDIIKMADSGQFESGIMPTMML